MFVHVERWLYCTHGGVYIEGILSLLLRLDDSELNQQSVNQNCFFRSFVRCHIEQHNYGIHHISLAMYVRLYKYHLNNVLHILSSNDCYYYYYYSGSQLA